MTDYLIKNYSAKDDKGKPSFRIVNEDELFVILQDFHEELNENKEKIAVYKLGDCVLDFS